MGDDQIWHSANITPDLPTRDDIVNACTMAGFNRNGICIQVAGEHRCWVKYGRPSVIRAEGRTQAHVAGIVNANPASVVRVPEVYLGFSRGKWGYIVMDFVQGTTLANRKSPRGNYYKDDIKAVAAAVKQLTDIKMPANTAPGPVGGGLIGHDFFAESLSTLTYSTVGQLEAQINRVCFPLASGSPNLHSRALVANKVLHMIGVGLRVDFQIDTADGMVLCLSDPNDANFMIDDKGNLWAIDFGRTCFLPRSFMSYSLRRSSDVFVQAVARRLNYPLSPNLSAMSVASGRLVICNNNTLGK